jgi:hypothetical protein
MRLVGHTVKKSFSQNVLDIYVYSPADACGKCLNAGAFVSNAGRAF